VTHAAFERRPVETLEPRFRLVRRASGKHEFGERIIVVSGFSRARKHSLVRVQQSHDIFSRLERAEEQHVAVFRCGCSRRPAGRAGRTDRQALARHAESPLDFSGREDRRYENAIRALRVRAGERRIIAAHFGARALGVCQKIQIVNRDHVRGRACRQQQRMRGMRDVVRAAGQRLRLRPLEPMPREIEEADRHASIDNRRACECGSGLQAILPRARKQRQRQRGGRVGGGQGQERADQLVGVLPGAARFAQRGTIIDQDAHLFKSF
jgi:hypothetical protein